jgi:soluble lytic murein transglycosylase-like protein
LRRRHVVLAGAAILAVVLVAVFAAYLSRQRVRRTRVFPVPPKRPQVTAIAAGTPEQWTDQFVALEAAGRWKDLADLLDTIAKTYPNEYAKWQLPYLRARAAVESNDRDDALAALQPFLLKGNPFRDLALFHLSEVDEAAAAEAREILIFEYPSSVYREEAIDDHIEDFAEARDVKGLQHFAARLSPSAPTSRRRELDARLVEVTGAVDRGIAILRAGTIDDAADRAARALDKPEITRRLNSEQLALLGETMQSHRHFDRAVAILRAALTGTTKRDDILFAIGRSYFGDEKYAEALQTYVGGAAGTRDPKWKNTFLWHAARCAQLQGDDANGERFMTAAINVPGKFPATAAALTQRIRTRLKQKRFSEAAADLNAIRQGWPKDHALVEASLAYAVGTLGAGNGGAALSTLNAIPRNLLDKFEPYEIDYWRARALEGSNPVAAFAAYLNVLRAPVPTHFAYFARQRLDSQPLAGKIAQEIKVRDDQVSALVAKNQWDAARRIETDRVLLRPGNLDRLTSIYKHVPAYDAVLTLKPEGFPKFPLPDGADRMSMLMAMGLFDEAVQDVRARWPLRPARAAVTQSLAFNRGYASRDSIYAVEVLMNSVPSDYIPQLLPEVVRELLYPRYFYEAIAEDAKKFDADPTLVLAIMREESRFNPRAKSAAAARGLLQFIITTARDIGHEVGLVDLGPEDLYDPRVIIRLGAKYVATLSKEFGNDRYKAAAAYNAGPKQVALWSRMAPAPGDDYFLSAVSFDETKQYVRKVLNSYKRYLEIYGNAGPQGGVRMEP